MEEVKLGDTLEDGVDLGQVAEVIDKIGVKILDTKGELRDIGTVVEEIGNKWDTLSKAQQNAIAIVMAGKRQYNNLLALFDNWDMYTNLLDVSQNSEGTLQEQHEIYLESISAYEHKLHAEMQKLYSNLFPEDSIIAMNKGLTSFAEKLNKVVEGLGGIKMILPMIASLMVSTFSAKIANNFYNTITKISGQLAGLSTRVKDFGIRNLGMPGMSSEEREQRDLQARRVRAHAMNEADLDPSIRRGNIGSNLQENFRYNERTAAIEQAYAREQALIALQREERGIVQALTKDEQEKLIARDRQVVALQAALTKEQQLKQANAELQQRLNNQLADIRYNPNATYQQNMAAEAEMNAVQNRLRAAFDPATEGGIMTRLNDTEYMTTFLGMLQRENDLSANVVESLREQVNLWGAQGDASDELVGDLNNILDTSVDITEARRRTLQVTQDNRDAIEEERQEMIQMVNNSEHLTEEQRQALINQINLTSEINRNNLAERNITQQLERQRQLREQQIAQARRMARIQFMVKGAGALLSALSEISMAFETLMKEEATGAEKADALTSGIANGITAAAMAINPVLGMVVMTITNLGKAIFKNSSAYDKLINFFKSSKEEVKELTDEIHNLQSELDTLSGSIEETNEKLERLAELKRLAHSGKLTAEQKEELNVLQQQADVLEKQIEYYEKKQAYLEAQAREKYKEANDVETEVDVFDLIDPNGSPIRMEIGGGTVQEKVEELIEAKKLLNQIIASINQDAVKGVDVAFSELTNKTQSALIWYANTLEGEEKRVLNDYINGRLKESDKELKDLILMEFDASDVGYYKEMVQQLDEIKKPLEESIGYVREAAEAIGEDSPELLSLMQSEIDLMDAWSNTAVEKGQVAQKAAEDLRNSINSLMGITFDNEDLNLYKFQSALTAYSALQNGADPEAVIRDLRRAGIEADEVSDSVIDLQKNLFGLIQLMSGEFRQELIHMFAFGELSEKEFNKIKYALEDMEEIIGSSEIVSGITQIEKAYEALIKGDTAPLAALKGSEAVLYGSIESQTAWLRERYKEEQQIEKAASYQRLQQYRTDIEAQQKYLDELKQNYLTALIENDQEVINQIEEDFEKSLDKFQNTIKEADDLYQQFTGNFVVTAQTYQTAIDTIYNGGEILTKTGKNMLQSSYEAWTILKDIPNYEEFFYEGAYSVLFNLTKLQENANETIYKQIDAYDKQLEDLNKKKKELEKANKSRGSDLTLSLDIQQVDEEIDYIENRIKELGEGLDLSKDFRKTVDNYEMLGNVIDNLFNTIHEKGDETTKGWLRLTNEELYRIADIFPDLLNEYATFTDGVIYLNKAQAESYIKTKQEELKAEAQATQARIQSLIDQIDAELIMLESKKKANTLTLGDIAHAQALAAQVAIGLEEEKQNEMGNTDDVAATTASDMALNWDNAGRSMADSIAKASASVIQNLDQVGLQGKRVAEQIADLSNPIYVSGTVDIKSTYSGNGNIDVQNNTKGKIGKKPLGDLMKSAADKVGKIYQLSNQDINALFEQTEEELKVARAQLIALKGAAGNSYSGIGQKDKTGSSKKDPTLNDIEYEQDLYHYINQELERQESLLKRIQSKKDTLYGSKYLKALEKEQKSLKSINNLTKIKLDMQKADLAGERELLEKAYGAAFDENGLMLNYNDLLYAKSEEANKLAEAKNEDAYKKAKEEYEDMKDALDHYLDIQEETLDLEEEIIDRQVEILENNLEAITKKIEFDLQPTDDTVNFLDFLNSFYENDFYQTGENLTRLAQKYTETADSIQYYQEGIDKLQEAVKRGEISSADFNEEIRNQRDAMQDALLVLSEIEEEMKNAYADALDEATEKLEDHTETLEHYNSQMEHFISIMDLIGEGHEYGVLSDIYSSQKENYMEQLRVQQDWYDNLIVQRNLLEISGQEGTEAWLENANAIEEVEDRIYSLAEDALGALKDSYTNLIDEVVNKLDKALTNGSKIQNMLTQYERDRDLGDMYLDKPTQLYEIDSLQKDIEKTMENMTDKLQKQRLQGLNEELDLMRKQDKVSEYDMERMRAKFELMQAQIALEEAQDAKNTMRLTRTSQGTWEYTFTADKEAVEEAESKVNDAYNNLYQLSKEHMQDLEQQILDTVSAYEDELAQLYKDWADGKFESEEEFYRQRDALINYYEPKMTELLWQYNKVRTDNALDAEELILATSKETGEDLIKQIEENRDQFNEAVADMADRIGGDDEDSFKSISLDALENLDDAWTDYNDNIRDISNEVDISLGAIIDKTADLEDQSRTLADTIQSDVVPALQAEIEEVIRATAAHREEAAALREKIQAYLDYLEALNTKLTTKNEVTFDNDTDYAREALIAASRGDEDAMLAALEKRWAKLDSLGIDYDEATERANYYRYFDDITKNNNRELANQIQATLNGAYYTDDAIGKLDQYLGKGTGSGNGAVTNAAGQQAKHIDTSVDSYIPPEVAQRAIDQLSNTKTRLIETKDSLLNYVNSNNKSTNQNITINANFPNVTDSNEIEAAFMSMPTDASQYVNRK